MTQEEKQLLLIDLSARLPYAVICENIHWPNDGYVEVHNILAKEQKVQVFEDWIDISECRPYLRPMSSMTEEEEKIFSDYLDFQAEYVTDCDLDSKTNMFDWLNSRHFDYRGLIEKGLAIEAPEGMYK